MLRILRRGPAWVALTPLAALLVLPAARPQPAPAAKAPPADPYRDTVLPFVRAYCADCHKPGKASGELDLTRFDTAAKALADFRQWEQVVRFLKSEEMPPEKARQPTPQLRAEVVAALEGVLRAEARKSAGDPGVVPPRRLTNAEYDNTVHDLTGVDIRPAKAFPVDPASGEGFNNTGEALAVSPGLFKKYLAAAEQVGEHAVLTSAGLRFAPHPAVAFADRQKLYEQQILRFYEAHAVDHEKVLAALWHHKHRPGTTVEGVAAERGLSAKYARLLWDALEGGGDDRFYLGQLRERWTALPPPAAPGLSAAVRALAAEARALGRGLAPVETPAIVANAGNGPIDHLARRRKTADTRDTFDAARLAGQKLTAEYKVGGDATTVPVVIRLGDVDGAKAAGAVVVKGVFATNAETTDKKRRWTLRELLAEHAPDKLAELKFGTGADADSFVLPAPGVVEVALPATAFPLKGKGTVTFTAECRLDPAVPGLASVRLGEAPALPLADPRHPSAAALEASAAAVCRLFPSRFYSADDTRGLSAGFHLIEGFFRDDRPLCRSVLSDAELAELDRLWAELYFVTGIWERMLRGFVFFERSERDFMKHPDFDSFREEDPELVKDATVARLQAVYVRRSNVRGTPEEVARHPVNVFFDDARAGLKRQAATLRAAEPLYLRDLLAFAERAYRRPLTPAERQKLEATYAEVCRDPQHGVEAAVRATVARVLVSPHVLMRFEATPAGDTVAPLPDLSLASRLSYFVWAGPPDAELLELAKAGRLRDEAVLRQQVRRMLRDPKVSRFALEFFGQWLGHREFLSHEAVNRQAFPAFDDALRQAMFEEPTRLVTHLIQADRPVTELLDGDATFVNRKLAQHYGLPFDGGADEWKHVTGLRAKGRGGVLGMGVFLTKNSQPQRTSPVKRGFWVVHKVLGEHIPPPPPDVAVLPAKETDTNGKTIRDLLKLHVADVKCAGCHQRFDPVGLAMEGFDPVGRARAKDSGGRAVDDVVTLPDGTAARGVPEFGSYLAARRKAEFARTLCRKFLGYALGRSVALSDQPLLDRMAADLDRTGYKLSALFDLVATSPQFRTQRCKDFAPARFQAVLPPGDRR